MQRQRPPLTPAQVQLVLKFYGPVVNPRTKEQIFLGYALGSELGWGVPDWIGRMLPESLMGRGQYLRYALFQDANWDYMTFDFDSGMARADRLDGGVTNAVNPDLRGFFRRGGKLLQYHGWSDPGISPFNSIDYYNSVLKFLGGADKVEGSYRLFMVPGMDHCALGEGPNTFDAIAVIEQWVEQGKAPERVIASRFTDGKVDRTRPLCPYPQVAKYKGMGNTDDAANFSCHRRLDAAGTGNRSERSGPLGLDFQRLPTTAPIAAPATTPIHIQTAIECVAAPIATPTPIPTAIQTAIF